MQYTCPQAAQVDKEVSTKQIRQVQKNTMSTNQLANINREAREFFDKFHTGQVGLDEFDRIFNSTFENLLKLHSGSNPEKNSCEVFKSEILLKTLSLLQIKNMEAVRNAQALEGQEIANQNSSDNSSWNYFNSEFVFQKRDATTELLRIAQGFANESGLSNPTAGDNLKGKWYFDDNQTTRWVMNAFDFPDDFEPPRGFSVFHCRFGKLIISETSVDLSSEEILSKKTSEGYEELVRRTDIELLHLILAISIVQHILKTDEGISGAELQVKNRLSGLLEQVYWQHEFEYQSQMNYYN